MPRRSTHRPRGVPMISERRIELDPGMDAVHELLSAAPPEDPLHGRVPVIASDPELVQSPLAQRWVRVVEATQGRLVRGRVYLREGAVLDLQVQRGLITAEVQGTRRYRVKIAVSLPVGELQGDLRERLAGSGGLTGEDLQQAILALGDSVFPAPRHIIPFCPCLDSAPFCKHVCAALHGFGVRLDGEPGLLLVLRGLVPDRVGERGPSLLPLAPEKALHGDLGAIFGIDLMTPCVDAPSSPVGDPRGAAIEAREEAARLPEIAREYLRTIGIPTHVIDAWLREGVLRRTGRHGIYERSPEADRRISAHLPGDDGSGPEPGT